MTIKLQQPQNPVLSTMQANGQGALWHFDDVDATLLTELQAIAVGDDYWLTRGAVQALNGRLPQAAFTDWLAQNDYLWQANGHALHDADGLVYAVLNVSPESFYNGDQVADLETMLARVETMLANGADIIEVGGQTTKPGYIEAGLELTPAEEIARVTPYITAIKTRFPQAVIAIDTYKYDVMVAAVELGVDIINDIHSFTDDARKLQFLASVDVGLLTMWNPREAVVTHLMTEMGAWFEENLATLTAAGIAENRIALDPGVGYARNSDYRQDLAMMNTIAHLQRFKRPVMTAVSNKGWAKFWLDLPKEARADVSLVAATEMFHRGARVLRVHDIKSAKQMAQVVNGMAQSYWNAPFDTR